MVKYLVSSHVQYAAVTLPRLLGSMTCIDPRCIVVVIGGATQAYEEVISKVQHIYVPHNSFDYTGALAVLELGLEAEWWFWLHDTCECGPRFQELAEWSFDRTVDH